MVLLHSKVPAEGGSSSPTATHDPTLVSLWLGLFAVPVLPSACHSWPCHGDVWYPCAMGCPWSAPFWSCVGFVGLSQRDSLCSCPCTTPGTGHRAAPRGATNTWILSPCHVELLRHHPLWGLQSTRQIQGSKWDQYPIIIMKPMAEGGGCTWNRDCQMQTIPLFPVLMGSRSSWQSISAPAELSSCPFMPTHLWPPHV